MYLSNDILICAIITVSWNSNGFHGNPKIFKTFKNFIANYCLGNEVAIKFNSHMYKILFLIRQTYLRIAILTVQLLHFHGLPEELKHTLF